MKNNYVEILPLANIMYRNVQIQQAQCLTVMYSDYINARSTEDRVLKAKERKLLLFQVLIYLKFVDLPI